MAASGTRWEDTREAVGRRMHGRDEEEATGRDATKVPRFAHGSRVPGWDEPVDLSKEPMGIPDRATTPVPDELRAEIEAHMAKYPDRRSAALPALAAAQRLHGWCSPEAIEQTAVVMRLTPAYLASVATFYDMFDTEPVGRHRVYVCTNISCSLNGADALYDRLKAQTKDSDDIHVRHFECLGACDIAPMASVDGIYIGPIELDEVPELVEQITADRQPLPDKQLRRRLSVDPNANTKSFPAPSAPLGALPDQAPKPDHPLSGTAGPLPDGPELADQPAPVEQPPDVPLQNEEDDDA